MDLVLLEVIRAQPAHGYAVVKEVRRRSGGKLDVAEGTLYPALYRLEGDGLIESEWADAEGKGKRVYRITPRGRKALGERVKSWQEFRSGVQAVLEGGAP